MAAKRRHVRKTNANGNQPTSMHIPKPIHAWLKRVSLKQDLTVSQYLRRVIQAHYDFETKNKGNLDPEPT